MKKESFIQKKDSLVIYAIAALLMVFHHLYAFPERFPADMIPGTTSRFGICALYFGYYAKICVAMYAFVSGYGMLTKWNRNDFRQTNKFCSGVGQSVMQAVKFYTRYWLVLCVFLCLGIIMGKYSFHGIEFLKNLIGISSSYNAEWWYVPVYVTMIILFPFLLFGMKGFQKTGLKILVQIGITVFLLVLCRYGVKNVNYLICFWFGMVLAEWRLLERLPEWKGAANLIVAAFCIAVSLGLKFVVSMDNRWDFVPLLPLIYGIVTLNHNVWFPEKLKTGFGRIGRYSIYIWLIHTFFLYYYFQSYLLRLRYSVLIYFVTLILSLICGYLCDKLYTVLKKQIMQIRQ